MEEMVYDINCDICESSTEVIVDDLIDEKPAYCPMCGSPIEIE
jgi:transcription elongation factor Elf1